MRETSEPITLRERAHDVFSAFGFAYAWAVVSAFSLRHLPLPATMVGDGIKWDGIALYVGLVPLCEELAFRFLPLLLALRYLRGRMVTVAIILAGAAFAAAHLHKYPLAIAVTQMWPIGIVFGMLFVGHARRGSAWKAYLGCVAAHAIYSFTALAS